MGAKGGRKAKPDAKSRAGTYWLLGAVVVVGGIVFAMTRGDGDDGGAGARTCAPVSGFSDLHGLALDPARPERMYAATHHGLFRATNDTGWCRVGSMQDDLMGFSMHPNNGSTFWVSGHPRFGGNMGVRQSTDGGYAWETLALKGVDFHSMAVSPADPDRLWGSWDGNVYRSVDGGHAWRVIGDNPEPIRSFAPHPSHADVVYAVGSARVWRSADAGATWQVFLDRAAAALALDPGTPATMYAFLESGMSKSTDAGATWRPLPLQTDGGTVGFIVVSPADTQTVYAATYQTGIHRSNDGGSSWMRVKPPSS